MTPISSSTNYAFGDSFTLGQNSAGYNSYSEILRARFACQTQNLAVSGTGVSRAVTNAFASLPAALSGKNVTLMAGFNDLSRGNGPETLGKITGEVTAFLANAFLASAVPADSPQVSRSGVWSDVTAGAFKQKATLGLSGNALFCAGSAAASMTWGFPGDSLVIGMWDSSGANYTLSPVEIRIDGVLVETYAPQGKTDGNAGAYANEQFYGLSHTARVFTGLGSGSHSVEIRKAGSNHMFVDYFGTLAAPGQCPRVFVADIPYLNDAGYGLLPLRSRINDDAGSVAIRAVVERFKSLGFPAYSVPVNDFYDVTNGVSADNLHPNVKGHSQISQAFCNAR